MRYREEGLVTPTFLPHTTTKSGTTPIWHNALGVHLANSNLAECASIATLVSMWMNGKFYFGSVFHRSIKVSDSMQILQIASD